MISLPLTLMRFMIAAAVLPMLAAAQVPPVKAKPPREPKLGEVPVPRIHPKFANELDFSYAPSFELLKEQSMELMALKDEWRFESKFEFEREHLGFDTQVLKEQALGMKEQALAMKDQIAQLDVERFKMGAEAFKGGVKPLDARPRAPWASEDPADSLYRVAREALNRGEYRRAAQVFNELVKKYPRSEYAVHSQYWEAFARYRAGGTDDLKEAIRILDEGRAQLASLRSGDNVDVEALRKRILGALAARGDSKAAQELQNAPSPENGGCDREDISVRAEALAALAQIDPAAAKPAIRKVLQRRDECTTELRRRALYLVGRNPDGDAAGIFLDVAKNDPVPDIRSEAIRLLPRVAGDNAVPLLEEMLRTTTDERMQRSIVYALASIDSERSRRAIRAVIERNDATERMRYEAIMSLSREKEGRVNPDDMAYLRALYPKLESVKLREALLSSLSRGGTAENEQFLLAVARNVNESPSLRASALQRLGRMSAVSVADIAKLYDSADARSLREQILRALSERKETEAIDKMMEIARKDTDPQIRRYAIALLSRSNNERAKQLLKEMIEQ
jgi:HEAT repeat protein